MQRFFIFIAGFLITLSSAGAETIGDSQNSLAAQTQELPLQLAQLPPPRMKRKSYRLPTSIQGPRQARTFQRIRYKSANDLFPRRLTSTRRTSVRGSQRHQARRPLPTCLVRMGSRPYCFPDRMIPDPMVHWLWPSLRRPCRAVRKPLLSILDVVAPNLCHRMMNVPVLVS